MDLSVTLACISAGISFFGVLQYVRAILYGGTKPRMASWVAWLTANSIFTIIAFQQEAVLAGAINIVAASSNALVIAISVKKKVRMKPADSIDWACLVASIVCVSAVFLVPEDKMLVALLAMVANIIATTPTFRHAWSKPHEEAWQLFAANASASALGVAGIIMVSGVELASIAGPLIAMLGNMTLVGITAGRKWLVVSGRREVVPVAIDEIAYSERNVE